MKQHARKPFLVALALTILALPVAALAGKSDRFGRQIIAYEEPIDGGTRTRSAPLPVTSPYTSEVEGCMKVECSLVGDAGVVMGIIPTDGGTFFPQAGARYVATVTTATGVRVHNQACNAYAAGAGRLLNEGAVLDFTTPKNPDGGIGDLALHCCSLAASSASAPALFQLCPKAQ